VKKHEKSQQNQKKPHPTHDPTPRKLLAVLLEESDPIICVVQQMSQIPVPMSKTFSGAAIPLGGGGGARSGGGNFQMSQLPPPPDPFAPSDSASEENRSFGAISLSGPAKTRIGNGNDGNDENHVFDKTKLCKFHLRRRCKRGQDCTFAHSTNEILPQPDFFKTQLCSEYVMYGSCKRGDHCQFAHRQEELRRAVKNPRTSHRNNKVSAAGGTLPAPPLLPPGAGGVGGQPQLQPQTQPHAHSQPQTPPPFLEDSSYKRLPPQPLLTPDEDLRLQLELQLQLQLHSESDRRGYMTTSTASSTVSTALPSLESTGDSMWSTRSSAFDPWATPSLFERPMMEQQQQQHQQREPHAWPLAQSASAATDDLEIDIFGKSSQTMFPHRAHFLSCLSGDPPAAANAATALDQEHHDRYDRYDHHHKLGSIAPPWLTSWAADLDDPADRSSQHIPGEYVRICV